MMKMVMMTVRSPLHGVVGLSALMQGARSSGCRTCVVPCRAAFRYRFLLCPLQVVFELSDVRLRGALCMKPSEGTDL